MKHRFCEFQGEFASHLGMLPDTPAVFDMIGCGLGQNSISGGRSGHTHFCWRTCMITDGRRTRP